MDPKEAKDEVVVDTKEEQVLAEENEARLRDFGVSSSEEVEDENDEEDVPSIAV